MTPALLTSTSSLPSRAIVASTKALACASSATSVVIAIARLDAIGAPRRQRHRGAGLRGGQRRRLADARRRARDRDDLP